MTSLTQHGYLVLADISGYTSYLAGVELDHAHEILTDLLETIVSRFKTLLTLSKLEGDAVFAYVPESRLQRGETLLELIEDTYVAFRDRLEAVRRRTTCECKACQAIPTLDLKFLAHHGDYIIQEVSGIKELVGSDVNLVHRLLKNHVSEATGWKAYALFTEASLQHTGLHIDELNAHPQTETYEHLGDVKTLSLDLHPRYRAMLEQRREFLQPEDAHFTLAHDYPLPPPVLWQWLNDPRKIIHWAQREMHPAARPGGRTGPGARNHCVHGQQLSMVETVLDWRPFEYFTVDQESKALPGNFKMTYQLEPTPVGTHLTWSTSFHPKLPVPEFIARAMCLGIARIFSMDKELDHLAHLIADDLKGELAPSPALAASA